MKRGTLLMIALLSACGHVTAEDQVGPSPGDKEMIEVPESERNPFTKEEPKAVGPVVTDKAESEEDHIRAALGKLQVVGRTRGPEGWKVLLGDIILVEGRDVPPVIEGQTERLRVAAIYDGAVELVWLDEKGEPGTRRMFIPIDLYPRVRSAIEGSKDSAVLTAPVNHEIRVPHAASR